MNLFYDLAGGVTFLSSTTKTGLSIYGSMQYCEY